MSELELETLTRHLKAIIRHLEGVATICESELKKKKST